MANLWADNGKKEEEDEDCHDLMMAFWVPVTHTVTSPTSAELKHDVKVARRLRSCYKRSDLIHRREKITDFSHFFFLQCENEHWE